ncbi:hypothetical protein [Blastomonas fulva]|uniref:hypothetical protein n=1 Tax=Blastomonas fulva TaxID=1550728 RepID=UPI003D28EA23
MRDIAVGECRALSSEEQMHFFRKGLKEELEHTTRHFTDPQRGDGVQALHSKKLDTAYTIIGSIDDSAEAVTKADIAAQLSEHIDDVLALLVRKRGVSPTPDSVAVCWKPLHGLLAISRCRVIQPRTGTSLARK